VGEESEERALQVLFPTFFDEPLQDLPVAYVYTIESSNGHYTGLRVVVIGKTLNG
jgi:hypothetical protein